MPDCPFPCRKQAGGWATEAPLSSWHGVTCCTDTGRVERLVLESNNLRGHLPACLGELGHLKVLRLCSNQLAGGIPQEIGGCKALRELVLNQNELTGKCIQACRPSTRAHHGAR